MIASVLPPLMSCSLKENEKSYIIFLIFTLFMAYNISDLTGENHVLNTIPHNSR
jgi:hypothetical protein